MRTSKIHLWAWVVCFCCSATALRAEVELSGSSFDLYFNLGAASGAAPEVVESVDGVKLLHVPDSDPAAAKFVTYCLNVTKLPGGEATARVAVRWVARTFNVDRSSTGIRNISVGPGDYPDGNWVSAIVRADAADIGLDSTGAKAEAGDIGGALQRIDGDPTLSTADFPPGTIDTTGFLTIELQLGLNYLVVEPVDADDLHDGCGKAFASGHQFSSITFGPGVADLEGEFMDSAPSLALPLNVDVGRRGQENAGALADGFRAFDGDFPDIQGAVTQVFDNVLVTIDTGAGNDSSYRDTRVAGDLLRDFTRGLLSSSPGLSDQILTFEGLPPGTYTLTAIHNDPLGGQHRPITPYVFGDVSDVKDGKVYSQSGLTEEPAGGVTDPSVGRSVVTFTGGGTVQVRYVPTDGVGGGASITNPYAVFLNAFTLAAGEPGDDAPEGICPPEFPEAPLSVDLNRGNHRLRRSLEDGFQALDGEDVDTQGAVTRTVQGVAITVDNSAGGESNRFEDRCISGNLLRDFNSAGDSTELVVTLGGLPPGAYKVTGFHNDAAASNPPLVVTVGGAVSNPDDGGVFDQSQLTEAPEDVLTDPAVGRSTVRFGTFGDGDVELRYASTGSGDVVLNGFIVEPIDGAALIPSDANADAELDVSDTIQLAQALFISTSTPLPCPGGPNDAGNGEILDHNGDGVVDLSDAVSIVNYLFISFGRPPALGLDCIIIFVDCPDTCP